MRWHLLGALLLASSAALAQPTPSDAPATAGPSGSAAPIDPYGSREPSPTTTPTPTPTPTPTKSTTPTPIESPAAPAPSQQQAPAQAPEPDTTPTAQPPNAPPAPAKPASEQQPNPPTDKPAPAPVDQPAPQATDKQTSSNPVPAIDVASAPPACRSAGKLVDSRDRNAASAAKVSLALCVANANLAPLQLVDAEASVRDVDAATAASLAMLDEVASGAPPHWQVVALHAEGDLLQTMTQRMLAAVPAAPAGATQSALALHDSRVQLLQPLVQPWIERAQQAFTEVDRIAKAHPDLARNRQAADAIADSRRRLTAGIATR